MTDTNDRKSLTNLSLQEGFVLHPNYLIRVCGEPADLINGTTTGATCERINAINALAKVIDSCKEARCKIIEDKIPGLEDKSASNKLLKIKRNVFNVRPVTVSLLEDVKHLFSEEEYQQVFQVVEQVNQYCEFQSTLEQVYKAEFAETSELLVPMWQRQNLQHALSYSNSKLFTDFESLYRDPNKKVKPKKRRQLEAGLMRYATRSSLKTSPLSTFTPVFVGSWKTSDDAEHVTLSGQLENRMEVKSGLFQCLIDGVLKDYKRIKNAFSLKLNPTLKITEEGVFVKKITEGSSINGRVWGSGEQDIQFKMNQVIQCVLVAFHKSGQQVLPVSELVKGVNALAPKLQEDFVGSVINQLLEMQVFQVDDGFYGQNELLPWCKEIIAKAGEAIDSAALTSLEKIEQLLGSFPEASPHDRIALGRSIYTELEAFKDAIDVHPSDELSNPAFFENSYLVGDDVKVDQRILSPFIEDFCVLTKASAFFDAHQLIQTNFADYFLDKYGEEGECAEPLDCLKDFSEIYGAGMPDFTPDPEKVSPVSETTREFRLAIKAFNEYLFDSVFTGEDSVNLSHEDLEALVEKLPPAIRNRTVSHSFLGQIASKEENKHFVINQVFSGHSGLLSRFLEVLEEDKLKDIRDYLSDISRDGEYAEIPGLFGFNANKHPKLAEQELNIAPYPANREETVKVAPETMTLAYDKSTHKVYFKTPEGKLLDCVYHGFLMPLLLPNVHRVLTLLSMNGVLVYVLPVLRSGRFSSREKISLIPRISVGNTVLVRRSHMIPRELLPSIELPEVEFFREMRDFIEANKLPKSGFIRVSPFDTNPGSQDEKLDWANLDFKNMKPFYVDFDSPRLVQLLYLAMSRNDYPIVLSEALPDVDDQNLSVAGKNHVSEFQFEITKKAASLFEQE
ncbi:lantibiotic dehydratase [Alteromonas sp. a30]|uniref:lantibiotic dehydratase n=1 Tax=Alteromonas sp. a30 TaxID=2730917 RepID=UPI00227F4D80|nr:lantibiotic dehydratase [Alteromonas sp. a30]MCY7294754.1 hypothetical protein [Alteromonas sp. a30]